MRYCKISRHSKTCAGRLCFVYCMGGIISLDLSLLQISQSHSHVSLSRCRKPVAVRINPAADRQRAVFNGHGGIHSGCRTDFQTAGGQRMPVEIKIRIAAIKNQRIRGDIRSQINHTAFRIIRILERCRIRRRINLLILIGGKELQFEAVRNTYFPSTLSAGTGYASSTPVVVP